MKNDKSSLNGIDANIIVLIGYLGGLFLSWIRSIGYFAWLLPLIIYIIEKKNKFVKEQMAQSTVLYIITSITNLIFNLIWIIMFPKSYNMGLNLNNFSGSTLVVSIMNILSVTITVLITLIVIITSMKIWYYENYRIPIIGFFVPGFRDLIDKIVGNKKKKNEDKRIEEKNNKDNYIETESEEMLINRKSFNKNGKKKD